MGVRKRSELKRNRQPTHFHCASIFWFGFSVALLFLKKSHMKYWVGYKKKMSLLKLFFAKILLTNLFFYWMFKLFYYYFLCNSEIIKRPSSVHSSSNNSVQDFTFCVTWLQIIGFHKTKHLLFGIYEECIKGKRFNIF